MFLKTYRFDLHIHSCLSPCADLALSPSVIVDRAARLGLNALALTDHQSMLNCPAFAECCRAAGIVPWFGLEMSTAEEVHVLALFDDLGAGMAFGERFIGTLPPVVNRLDVFGEQVVVDSAENIIGFEWRMLAMASGLTLEEAVGGALEAGALVVASHVERPSFSMFSQMGFMTGLEGFDAVELSANCSVEAASRLDLAGYPVVRNSDAHEAEQLGRQWNEARLESFSVAEVRRALGEGGVRARGPYPRR